MKKTGDMCIYIYQNKSNETMMEDEEMQILKDRIRKDGKIREGNVLKVDSFLNHQMDVSLFREIGKEFKRRFANENINKILTIEASGSALAIMTGLEFGCPVVFAKKSKSRNISDSVYSVEVESFTHGNTNTVIVSKEYLKPTDRILITDDFLATGAALVGLRALAEQAGASVVGAGIAIEKAFQGGGDRMRAEGMRVESLAKIASMSDDGLVFCR